MNTIAQPMSIKYTLLMSNVILFLILIFFVACSTGPLSPTQENLLPTENNYTPLATKYLEGESTIKAAISTPTQFPIPTIANKTKQLPTPSASSLNYDLLWISYGTDNDKHNGELLRWNHLTGQVETLLGQHDTAIVQVPGAVLDYTINLEGTQIVYSVRTGYTEDYQSLVELNIMTLDSLHIEIIAKTTHIFESASPYTNISFSPDGQKIAYILLDTEIPEINTEITQSEVFIADINVYNTPVLLASCEDINVSPSCFSSVSWSRDGKTLAWRSNTGIWLSHHNNQGYLALENIPGDNNNSIRYMVSDFSPDNHHVLIRLGQHESGSLAVWDWNTGQIIEVPESQHYSFPGLISIHIWLNDGRLLQVRSDFPEKDSNAVIRIWEIDPDDSFALVERLSFEIDPAFGNIPSNPHLLPDGRVFFILEPRDIRYDLLADTHKVSLQIYDPVSNQLTQISEFITSGNAYINTTQIWLPDSSGVLFMPYYYYSATSDTEFTFTSLHSQDKYDFYPFIGPYHCCLGWSK